MTEPKPSSTVLVLRESANNFEVLLVKRNTSVKFLGDHWVFPGGKVESTDADDDPKNQALAAASRELEEETALSVSVSALTDFSHWTAPDNSPKRFSTWFFITVLPSDAVVTIDDSEIVEYHWSHPNDALERHTRGEIKLPIPTFVSLVQLQNLVLKNNKIDKDTLPREFYFHPKIIETEQGRCAVFKSDVAYETENIELEGQRHRLWMIGSCWRYIPLSDL